MRWPACSIAFVSLASIATPLRAAAGEEPSVVGPEAADQPAPAAPLPAPRANGPHVEPPHLGRWYGWQLILSDTVFLLLVNDSFGMPPEVPLGPHQFALSLGGVVLGAPAIHALHGNTRRALIGASVRLAAVLAYAALRTSDSDASGSDDLASFFLLGAVVATGFIYAFVDTFWYARAVEPPRAVVPAPARWPATIAPTAFFNRSGGGLGLAARF